jgi:hypothetical protein
MLLVNSAQTVLCSKVKRMLLLVAALYLLVSKLLVRAGAPLTLKKLKFFTDCFSVKLKRPPSWAVFFLRLVDDIF